MRTESARPTRKHSPPTSGVAHKKARIGGHRSLALARSALDLRALQGFRMIFGSARKFDANVRRTTGISGSLLWALSEIARTAGMSVNGLAKRLALHQTTASNLVNALVERKLIRRARSEADQRVVHLHISPQGTRVLGRAPGPHAGLLIDALRRLDIDQLERLRSSLETLVAAMRGAAATAAGETLLGE